MYKGNYVFSQITKYIPYYQFNKLVEKHQGCHYVKKFSCWNQLLAMLFGQLTHRESLRDIVNCLESQKGKLFNLGFSAPVKRSTLSKANEQRSWKIYRDLANILIKRTRELYINDTDFKIELKGAAYAIDASTIELCLSVFSWARLRTVRAGIKLNMQLDLTGNIPTFFTLTNAKTHDVLFLDDIIIEKNAYYILDRGYWDSVRLFRIDTEEAFFVIRDKRTVGMKRIYSNSISQSDKKEGLRCDQIVKFTGKRASTGYPKNIRRIKYYDEETKKRLVFLTNDFNIKALTIANLYRHRWQIELFFKWIKQHLKIKTFWGYSENAVKTQICIAICSYLLVAIAKKELGINRNLYEILQILQVTALTKKPLVKLLSEANLQKIVKEPSEQASLWDF